MNSPLYGELFDGKFTNVGCVVLENIDYVIITPYISHTFIRPFCAKIPTTIFILFSTRLLIIKLLTIII